MPQPAKIVGFAVAMLLCASHVIAQPATQPTTREIPTQPTLVISNPALFEQLDQPVSLQRLGVAVTVHGFLAQTSMTMTFHNPNDRIFEGELIFPLPEGVTVAGYALDVNGTLTDAVSVEKQRARIIFETEVSQSIDPGLVEWVGGNHFRTRVYPIPANGTRTIRVDYVTTLDSLPASEGGQSQLRVPLDYGMKVDEVELEVKLIDSDTRPKVEGAIGVSEGESEGDHVVLRGSAKDATLEGDLTITLPAMGDQLVMAEIDHLAGPSINGNLPVRFVVYDRPERPAAPPRKAISSLAIAWDASASRNEPAARQREIEVVEALCEQLRELEVRLTVLRERAEKSLVFDVKDGDAGELRKFLAELDYDGASLLWDKAVLSAEEGFMQADHRLLVTDGHFASNDSLNVALKAWDVLSASTSSNHDALRELAEGSGGQYIKASDGEPARLASIIGTPRFHRRELMGSGIRSGEPELRVQSSGDGFVLSGATSLDQFDLGSSYGYADSRGEPDVVRGLTIDRAEAVTDGPGLVIRYAVQQELKALLDDEEGNRERITELGEKYGLVTPFTSLLVLETLDQHVRYEVEPAESRPEMRKAYHEAMSQKQKQQETSDQEDLEALVAAWQERVKWWETKRDIDAVMAAAAPPPATQPTATEPAVTGAAPATGQHDIRDLMVEVPNFENAPSFDLATAVDNDEDGEGMLFGAAEGETNSGRVMGGSGGGSGGLFADEAEESAEPTRAEAPRTVATEMLAQQGQDEASKEDTEDAGGAEVTITAWNPKRPYLDAMKAVPADEAYGIYLKERETYGNSPAFYFDVSQYLLQNGQRELGLRVLSNIMELSFADARLMRVLAYRLVQADELEQALALLERVKLMRPEEPQSWRDLAMVEERLGEATESLVDRRIHFAGAGAYLEKLVKADEGIEVDQRLQLTALMELNRIKQKIDRMPLSGNWTWDPDLDERLIKPLDCDLRIVLQWDTNQTDVDLWVVEPTRELCNYNQPSSKLGGQLFADITDGYGPEEYAMRESPAGEYTLAVHFYGSNLQDVVGPTTVQATIFTDYGRPTEQRKTVTMQLATVDAKAKLATIKLGGDPE